MAYFGDGCSTQTPEERRAEADRILSMLESVSQDEFTSKEIGFIAQISHQNVTVSAKQLWWLRDIKDKYI